MISAIAALFVFCGLLAIFLSVYGGQGYLRPDAETAIQTETPADASASRMKSVERWRVPLAFVGLTTVVVGGVTFRHRRDSEDLGAELFESERQILALKQIAKKKAAAIHDARRRRAAAQRASRRAAAKEAKNRAAPPAFLDPTFPGADVHQNVEQAPARRLVDVPLMRHIIQVYRSRNDEASARREIDLKSRQSESPLIRLAEDRSATAAGSILARDNFADQLSNEHSRHHRGGSDGALVSLVLPELESVRLQKGTVPSAKLFADVARRVARLCRPIDTIGLAGPHELAILMPDIDERSARETLAEIAEEITSARFTALGERVLLTPATGFAMLSDAESAPELLAAAEGARERSKLSMDLDPARWLSDTSPVHAQPAVGDRWTALRAKLRTPAQIALTFVIAWVLPFLIYVGLNALGLDISYAVYILFVISLVATGALIMVEGFMALRQKEPPEIPSTPYPKASAVIAAYLPNEAATVVETIEAFLAVEYPNDLQIILAYNTPDTLPIEEHLDRIAKEHPNFIPVRIVGSSSKAQNVNAALSMADGAFIGMFDADHLPRPDAFTRAWRWIDAGYDVVQGHCLTRNGEANLLTKMIAVEFESIYSVAHPGRAKMHKFGVFGGSNGFWRTELLHGTRMRGSMLTEDIDSSMRVIERGYKIRSDRDLVSRELGTTTFPQIWNQRIRWAQGWFQVSLEHIKYALKSDVLTRRQKLGLFHLLLWREIYPWLSQQLVPLLAFWSLQAGGLERLDWTVPIFVATSLFTFCVGPAQTVFAYILADEEIKQHRWWFVAYLIFSTPFYTEYKNLIARVAHVKQIMGESDWRVTPRPTS